MEPGGCACCGRPEQLARIPASIDHTILGVVARNGQESIIMRDVSDLLVTIDAPIPKSQLRQLLHGLAEFHISFEDYQLAGLCSLTARYRMSSPKLRAEDMGPNPNPLNNAILAGWQTFSEVAPADVVEAIRSVHDEPEQLADALLASAPVTLLHGDFRIGNIGFDGQRVVVIDWGELTSLGPAEFDVAWFASVPGRRVAWTPDDVFNLYSEQATRRLDPTALDLACIGALALQGGWYGALLVRDDEMWQAYGRYQLGWWSDRVRRALSTWSPV
jgi:hypothetical protein